MKRTSNTVLRSGALKETYPHPQNIRGQLNSCGHSSCPRYTRSNGCKYTGDNGYCVRVASAPAVTISLRVFLGTDLSISPEDADHSSPIRLTNPFHASIERFRFSRRSPGTW